VTARPLPVPSTTEPFGAELRDVVVRRLLEAADLGGAGEGERG